MCSIDCNRGGSSRSRSRPMCISKPSAVTSSVARCERIWSRARKNGAGQACGSENKTGKSIGWTHGRCVDDRNGSPMSTERKPKRKWPRCAGVSSEATPMATRLGRSPQQKLSAWNRPCGHTEGPGSRRRREEQTADAFSFSGKPTSHHYFSTPRSFSTASSLAFVVFAGSIVAVRRPSRKLAVAASTPSIFATIS